MALRVPLKSGVKKKAPVAFDPLVERASVVFEAGEDVVIAPYSLREVATEKGAERKREEVVILQVENGGYTPLRPLASRPVLRIESPGLLFEVGVDVYRASDVKRAVAALALEKVDREAEGEVKMHRLATLYLLNWAAYKLSKDLERAVKRMGFDLVNRRLLDSIPKLGGGERSAPLLRVPGGARLLLVPGFESTMGPAKPIALVKGEGGAWSDAVPRGFMVTTPGPNSVYLLALPLEPGAHYAAALLLPRPDGRRNLILLAADAPPGDREWLTALHEAALEEGADLLEPPHR